MPSPPMNTLYWRRCLLLPKRWGEADTTLAPSFICRKLVHKYTQLIISLFLQEYSYFLASLIYTHKHTQENHNKKNIYLRQWWFVWVYGTYVQRTLWSNATKLMRISKFYFSYGEFFERKFLRERLRKVSEMIPKVVVAECYIWNVLLATYERLWYRGKTEQK